MKKTRKETHLDWLNEDESNLRQTLKTLNEAGELIREAKSPPTKVGFGGETLNYLSNDIDNIKLELCNVILSKEKRLKELGK